MADFVFYPSPDRYNPMYPYSYEFDLGAICSVGRVGIVTPEEGYSQYSVFVSRNGRDFSLAARKTDREACRPPHGESYDLAGVRARFLRVLIEYNSKSPYALLTSVTVSGEPTGEPFVPPEPIFIPAHRDTDYSRPVTEREVFEEVRGVVSRRIGERYADLFALSLAENPKGNGRDYFSLSDLDGRISVRSNNGVGLCRGIYHYLKRFCRVSVSQVGDQTHMPERTVPVGGEVFRETAIAVRYAYNYCTFSYSTPFWGEAEWRRDLDWLALNGVNAVLDLTAQEEVWRRFLGKLGYSHKEILRFIAGPAYSAFSYMALLFGFGGPVHDSHFAERTELARRNHRAMRALGMQPVLQGYFGMVPPDISERCAGAEVIPQGKWCRFRRADFVRTDSVTYRRFARLFYQSQREVFGDVTHLYAGDPFHEGGDPGDLSPRVIGKNVTEALVGSDPDGVWLIQSWRRNPTSELLEGIAEAENGRSHAIILDLWAEKVRNYPNGGEGKEAHGYRPEFNGTPWAFCMLNNFGGRLGVYGEMPAIAKELPEAYNNCRFLRAIGITPEAVENNPVIYDVFFDMIWMRDADEKMAPPDLPALFGDFAVRRCGAYSENAVKAWQIFLQTAYNGGRCQGAPECVVNARPSLDVKTASAWGTSRVHYDKKLFREGVELLLADRSRLPSSSAYDYDCVTFVQQALSNDAQDVLLEISAAYEKRDTAAFELGVGRFFAVIDEMERLLGSNGYYRLSRWTEMAERFSRGADDHDKMLCMLNARAIITTWGGVEQAESGHLADYSNRQWAGVIGDYCRKRWELFFDGLRDSLSRGCEAEPIDFFEYEWSWVRRFSIPGFDDPYPYARDSRKPRNS